MICLEEKLPILVGGSTISATLMDGGSWTELPGLAACWEGAVLALPWHIFPLGKYYLHFSVPGKGHSGLG